MSFSTTDDLVLEQKGPIATVTFNRPAARNAMTWAMFDGLYEICERLDGDRDTRVLVLTGAGDRAFVSGTDIRQFQEFRTKEDVLAYESRVERTHGRLAAMSKPTIAMIRGSAVGGGLFMALACDLRVCDEGARFGAPVARTLGNFPAPGGFARLVAAVGPVRAREIMLTARLVEAAEASRVGLVDRVYPAGELEEAVQGLAKELAGLAPVALAAIKEATRRVSQTFTLQPWEDIIMSCYESEDFKEGVRSFVEKRRPQWQGR